jgi:hypothetical protein
LYAHGGEIARRLTEAEFSFLAGIWFICEYVKDLWRVDSAKEGAPALERRWMVFFAVGESLRIMYGLQKRNYTADVQRLGGPWWTNKSPIPNPTQEIIKRHTELAFKALRKAYDLSSKTKDFRHRNWFRQESTLEEIRSNLRDYCDIARESADKYLIRLKE